MRMMLRPAIKAAGAQPEAAFLVSKTMGDRDRTFLGS